jgi:hypothetical protein
VLILSRDFIAVEHAVLARVTLHALLEPAMVKTRTISCSRLRSAIVDDWNAIVIAVVTTPTAA